MHSFNKYWASKICQALTFQETIQKGLVALRPPSLWFIYIHSRGHTLGTGWVTPNSQTETTPFYLCPCPTSFLFSYVLFDITDTLISLSLEFSRHTCIQTLTYLEPTISLSNNTLSSTLHSSLLCPLCLPHDHPRLSPIQLNHWRLGGMAWPQAKPWLWNESAVCNCFCQLPA